MQCSSLLASTLDDYSRLLFSPFPLSYIRLLQPDVGVQEPDATVDDNYYYSGGAYYYVQPVDDDQE